MRVSGVMQPSRCGDCFESGLANQLYQGFCSFEVERFSDVNLVTLEMDLRDSLAEE